ncbi:hypothetical protein BKA56DRAFT_725734 [Ilyonectria sp. MPI-CAGE-AT-0026]|nr:hypothetical protein BKA56DRAFT_725734 [Ilyonectria sp. MPI-CAGE-AT-0026]
MSSSQLESSSYTLPNKSTFASITAPDLSPSSNQDVSRLAQSYTIPERHSAGDPGSRAGGSTRIPRFSFGPGVRYRPHPGSPGYTAKQSKLGDRCWCRGTRRRVVLHVGKAQDQGRAASRVKATTPRTLEIISSIGFHGLALRLCDLVAGKALVQQPTLLLVLNRAHITSLVCIKKVELRVFG